MINEVNKTKCSATLRENRLTRKQHITNVFGKISSGIGMIVKGHPYENKQELISNYYSFIYPYLNYYNYIWGSTYKTSLKRLITCQNKAIWIIAHAIEEQAVIQYIRTWINTYLIGCFMFCMSIGKVPESLTSIFKAIGDFHSCSTSWWFEGAVAWEACSVFTWAIFWTIVYDGTHPVQQKFDTLDPYGLGIYTTAYIPKLLTIFFVVWTFLWDFGRDEGHWTMTMPPVMVQNSHSAWLSTMGNRKRRSLLTTLATLKTNAAAAMQQWLTA